MRSAMRQWRNPLRAQIEQLHCTALVSSPSAPKAFLPK